MGDRWKDTEWTVTESKSGYVSYDAAALCVLMDLRDELKRLNNVLSCYNLGRHEEILKRIARNTTKRKRVKK